jgi:hypothetical protein
MLWSLKVTWYIVGLERSRAFHTLLSAQDKCPGKIKGILPKNKEAGSTLRATGSYLILSTLSSSKVVLNHRRNELVKTPCIKVKLSKNEFAETEGIFEVSCMRALFGAPHVCLPELLEIMPKPNPFPRSATNIENFSSQFTNSFTFTLNFY